MIQIEHSSLYIQSINNIRLMQRLRVNQEKRDVTFAELLGKEMRNEDVVNQKDNAH